MGRRYADGDAGGALALGFPREYLPQAVRQQPVVFGINETGAFEIGAVFGATRHMAGEVALADGLHVIEDGVERARALLV